MWIVSTPLWVMVSKRKRFWLNLNQYRNAHHHTLDKAKKEFKNIVEPRLSLVPFSDRIRMSFVLYAPNNQRRDVSNVCSVVDKFFSDCLVETGKLIDDDKDHLPMVAYGWGGIDKNNPRVEVVIERI